MTDNLYVDPHHRVPDDEWGDVVRRAQAIHEAALANKTGGAASPAGPVIDMRGRSNKHSGVSGMPTQLLVLHSAECPLRGGYAQSLTEWAITSAVIASWQRFIDPIARVYMIDDNYAAWHASEANPMSIGWEQAGYARYTRDEWTTPDGMLQMESLAYDMAQVALRDGIPPVWLTTNQVTAITTHGDRATKGFCLHRQIDPESRTDPGDGYPYELLMQKIRSYMGQGITTQSITTPEDDVANTPIELQEAVQTVLRDNPLVIGGRSVAAGVNQALLGIDVVNDNIAQLKAFIAQRLEPSAGVKSESEGTFYFKGTDKPEVYALDAATGNVRHVQFAEFDIVKAINLYKEVDQAKVDALLGGK